MIPKFRAYVKEKNEIWSVKLIDFVQNTILAMPIGEKDDKFMECFNENGYELLPFTGLCDKNGNEIYKGHIIYGFIVDYVADAGASLGMNAGWYLQRDNFESWVELECSTDYEIIGDIYTTPELLK